MEAIDIKCETKDTLPLSALVDFQGGLKQRTDDDFEKITKSIKKHGFKFPFFVWQHDGINHVLDGHGRLGALQRMVARGETLPELPVVYINCKDEADAKEVLLKLNSQYGKMTADSVYEFMDGTQFDIDELALPEGVLDLSFSIKEEEDPAFTEDGPTLYDRFLIPPMSVLDTRSGVWQKRKAAWLKITGDLSETRTGEYGQTWSGNSKIFKGTKMTSTFDPVLAELMYDWFCIPGGKIIDPFGGEQTKGVVAGVKEHPYRAVEFRQDQVDLNNEKTAKYNDIKYFCGDSNNIDKIIKENDFDLCFTSPPYYDLEVYSKEDMSALGTYEEFMAQYKNIFSKCYDKLKEDSFLVVKISEIRDKKTGIYRGFVPDNIRIMEEIGFVYYNEIILVNPISATRFRAGNNMKTRKLGRTHQNVLVFYKGDVNNIKNKFPAMEDKYDDKLFDLSE